MAVEFVECAPTRGQDCCQRLETWVGNQIGNAASFNKEPSRSDLDDAVDERLDGLKLTNMSPDFLSLNTSSGTRWSRRMAGQLFNFDYFLAHRSIDGRGYAIALQEDLAKAKSPLNCFLDIKHYGAGHKLPELQSWALGKTTRLLVVVTPRAHDDESEYLRREITEFRRIHPRGLIVPIGTQRTLDAREFPDSKILPLLPSLPESICILEEEESLLGGRPSEYTIRKLIGDFQEESAWVKRARWVKRASMALSVLLIATAIFAWVAWRQFRSADSSLRLSRKVATEGSLQSGLAALRRNENASLAALWYAHALQNIEDSSPPLRFSARTLLGGWKGSLPLKTFVHGDNVTSISFSPDGSYLATASDDRTAQVWDLSSGRPVGDAIHHGGQITEIEFDPKSRLVATACLDGTAGIWNASTGKLEFRMSKGSSRINGVTFSPDGRTLVTTETSLIAACGATLWDVATGLSLGYVANNVEGQRGATFDQSGTRLLSTMAMNGGGAVVWDVPARKKGVAALLGASLLGSKSNIKLNGREIEADGTFNSAAFSPDGLKVAAALSTVRHSAAGEVRLWDAGTGESAGVPLPHPRGVPSLSFSPDGTYIATGCDDGNARIWDMRTSKQLGESLQHQKAVTRVSYSPDGKLLATVSGEIARLFSVATGKPVGEPMVHDDWITCIEFSPGGQMLATGSADDSARLWSVPDEHPFTEILGKNQELQVDSISPNSRIFVSSRHQKRPGKAAGDETVELQLRDGISGQPLGASCVSEHSTSDVAISPECEFIAFGMGYEGVRLWDARAGKFVGGVLSQKGGVKSMEFSPDGKILAAGAHVSLKGDAPNLCLWRTSDGQPVCPPLLHPGQVHALAFSPDGTIVVSGDGKGNVRLWKADTGALVESLPSHDQSVSCVVFSPDGRFFATASDDYTAQIWITKERKPLGNEIKFDGRVYSSVFSPAGDLLATGSQGDKIVLWDVVSQKQRSESLVHNGDVRDMAFSPDGRLLASASSDSLIRVWDVRTGQLRMPPFRHEMQVNLVRFDSDGRSVLGYDISGALRRWEVSPPVADDSRRVWRSIQVRTGRTIVDGFVRNLGRDEWLSLKRELDQMGGDSIDPEWEVFSVAEQTEFLSPVSVFEK